MPKPETHTQCSLIRKGSELISWIPSKVAVRGATVRLKEEDGSWSEGWVVRATYATMASPECNERSRDHLHTREASDI